MKRVIHLLLIVLVVFINGCITSSDKKNSENNSEWKNTSLPKNLSGNWYFKGAYDTGITSSKITINNREWIIYSIETNGEEYRIIVVSDQQYWALYFRNITEKSAEKSFGEVAYDKFMATNTQKSSWIIITKG